MRTGMHWIDWAIVGLYVLVSLAMGFFFIKASAKGLKSYFLGDNTIPWWALAASGAATNFDISGTMWIVAMVNVFGMRSFWAFCGFAVFNAAFLMSYLAPWIRRTNVMTATELMKARFGDGRGGRVARMASAIGMVVFTAFCMGYSVAGIGKFAAEFLPLSPFACAVGIMTLTALYTLVGGFKSVIATDVFQAVLMSLCGLLVGAAAYVLVDPAKLHATGFVTSLLPVWKWDGLPAEYAKNGYDFFGAMCALFLLNGLLHSTGGAGGTYGEQRFLATRSPADSAKAAMGWGLITLPRFTLVAGIAFIVSTGMVAVPDDKELLLPQSIQTLALIPIGVKGFLLASLLAAFMSTYSSTINSGAGIFLRDIVEPLKPGLSERALVTISYLATAALTVAGLVIGLFATSINNLWVWMQLGFMPALLVPNVLRWYWWRMNGWAYAIGMLATAAVGMAALFVDAPPYLYAPPLYILSLVISVAVALVTPPTPEAVLNDFYTRVRPRGGWGVVRQRVGPLPPLDGPDGSGARIVLNVLLGCVLFMCAYFAVFYLIGHWLLYGGICVALCLASGGVLYFTWYLPVKRADAGQPR